MADVFDTVGMRTQSDIKARFDVFDALTMPRENPLVMRPTPQIPALDFEKMAREVQSFAGFNMEKKVRNAATLAATYDMPISTAFGLHDAFAEKLHENNFWEKSRDSLMRGYGNLYSMIGGYMQRKGIDPEGAERYLYHGDRLQRAYPRPAGLEETTWRSFADPEWCATTIMESVPAALALVPAAVVGAYAAAYGAGAAGLGVVGKVIFGALGGALLSRPIESTMESQGAYDEAKQRGFSEEDAERVADQVWWDNMKLTGMDAAELAAAFLPMGKLPGRITKRIMAQRILAATGKLGAVGLMEAGEERYQEKVVLDALGEPTSFFDFSNPRLNEASMAGAVFGVGLGGAGSVWNALANRITADMPKTSKQVYERARTKALANGAETQAAELAGLDAVASTPEGKAHIETVITDLKDLVEGKPARETEQPAVQPQEVAPGGEVGRLGIRRYADGESVGRISEQTAEEINKLGFSTNASDVKITQKTIDYIDEKRGITLTADDVDYLKKTIEEPTEVLPNIGKDQAEYRAKSVLIIRRNGKDYMSIVEVFPGENENILWNFWKMDIKNSDRYLKKFREEKARILESGGRPLPHVPPRSAAASGKPEGLSGSQTRETGTEQNIPLYEKKVNENQREGQENATESINNEIAQEGRRVAETTLNGRTFILSPEGSIDFGVVPDEIAEASNGRFPGAPIRLEEGAPDDFGRSHISKERIEEFKSLGYRDELDMLHDVAQHFTSIYEQPNGRLLLVKKNGKNKYAVVELQKKADNYYGATTWFVDMKPLRGKPYEERSGRKLLLDVARTPDTGLSVPFPTTGVESRASDSRRWDRSSSGQNIVQNNEDVNKESGLKSPEKKK